MAGVTNRYANIRVNAGETVIFSVKARNNDDLLSDMTEVDIHAPSAGEFVNVYLGLF